MLDYGIQSKSDLHVCQIMVTLLYARCPASQSNHSAIDGIKHLIVYGDSIIKQSDDSMLSNQMNQRYSPSRRSTSGCIKSGAIFHLM